MERDPEETGDDPLAEAEAIIARQAAEIVTLRQDRDAAALVRSVRARLALVDTASAIASPVPETRLIEMIVEAAAHIISARSAALFLVDEEAQELIFKVALGPKAGAVQDLRLPLGHGIAGLVAVTGQPMIVADAQRDPRQATDIAHTVDYSPESILCVPLFFRERVIGVLELLDKQGAPGFTSRDIEILGLFANQAAVAIEQSRIHDHGVAILADLIATLDTADTPDLQAQVAAFGAGREWPGEVDDQYRQALSLAALVREIAIQGESELLACRKILEGFASYLRMTANSRFGTGGGR
jgi:GAF domain-containing protein